MGSEGSLAPGRQMKTLLGNCMYAGEGGREEEKIKKIKKGVASILKSSWQQGMEREGAGGRRGADKETANNKKRRGEKKRRSSETATRNTNHNQMGKWRRATVERNRPGEENFRRWRRREERDKGGPVRNFFQHRTGLFLLSSGMRGRLYVMFRTQSPRRKKKNSLSSSPFLNGEKFSFF